MGNYGEVTVMKTKILAGIAIAGALTLTAGMPAQALSWPSDDKFVIGNGQWQITEYGVLYGWDAADVYDDNGYADYPTEGYSWDYLYCGADYSDSYTQSTITEEPNGDISIECPAWTTPWDYAPYTGVTMQSFVRLYHEEKGGYLARYLTTFTNSTGADIPVEDFLVFESTTKPDDFNSGDYSTSSMGNALASGDTWTIAGNTDGSTIYQTSAWAKIGNGTGFTLVSDELTFPAGSSVIPANGSVSIATFTFIVIPATQDAAGATAAFTVAQNQVNEYESFDGRLTCGIPVGTVVVGWGTATSDDCATPALPNTGMSSAQTVTLSATAASLVVVGFVTVMLLRRRRHGAN